MDTFRVTATVIKKAAEQLNRLLPVG
jgi:hypothetical protein